MKLIILDRNDRIQDVLESDHIAVFCGEDKTEYISGERKITRTITERFEEEG